jgi:hypothetical protein
MAPLHARRVFVALVPGWALRRQLMVGRQFMWPFGKGAISGTLKLLGLKKKHVEMNKRHAMSQEHLVRATYTDALFLAAHDHELRGEVQRLASCMRHDGAERLRGTVHEQAMVSDTAPQR